MKSPLEVKLYPLIFYLFLLVLFLFLASTIGGPFTGLAAFFFLFMSLDFGQMFWSDSQLFLMEKFNTEHPVKGDILEHRLTLETGKMPFRSCRIDLEMVFSNPLSQENTQAETLWLRGKGSRRSVLSFPCRHRGLYTLGLNSLELRSWFGWVTYSWNLFPRVFYVLPRILDLENFRFTPSREGVGDQSHSRTLPDPSLFDHMIPYREGVPLKFLNWKPLSRGAEPVVKKFLPEIWNDVHLFLDIYRPLHIPSQGTESQLDREDLALETAGTLIRYLLKMGIPVKLWTWKGGPKVMNFSTLEDFQLWLESTVQIQFENNPSLDELWRETGNSARGEGGFFISHRPDPRLWETLESLTTERTLFCLIKGWTPLELELFESRETGLLRSGCQVIRIEELEDLQRQSYV